jgi:hypothetical protein
MRVGERLSSAFCVKPRPVDQGELQGDPGPLHPALAHEARESQMRCRHVDVSWQDGDQEHNQAPSCSMTRGWHDESNAPEDLGGSADLDQREWRGEIGWHDLEISLRDEKVQTARCGEEDCQDNSADHAVYPYHASYRFKVLADGLVNFLPSAGRNT